MHPVVGRFIEVTEQDAKMFEDAALNINALVPHLVGDAQRRDWNARAEQYRARAKELRAILEKVRAQDWAQ